MFPLLERDGLSTVYAGLWVLWAGVMWPWASFVQARTLGSNDGLVAHESKVDKGAAGSSRFFKPDASQRRLAGRASSSELLDAPGNGREGSAPDGLRFGTPLMAAVVVAALHAAKLMVPPPENLLWLWDRVFITVSFAGFVLCWLYLYIRQWGGQALGSGVGSQVENLFDGGHAGKKRA